MNGISRAEVQDMLNALRDELTIRDNDGQYLVNRDSGGQVLEMTGLVADAPEEVEVTEYVTASYDSVAEEFTVTITDLPVIQVGDNTFLYPTSNTTVSQTLTFDLPLSSSQLTLYCGRARLSSEPNPDIHWSSALTASDQSTLDQYTTDASGNKFAQITVGSDGSYTFLITPTDRVAFGNLPVLPHIYVNTTQRKIYFSGAVYDSLNESVGTKSLVYVEPVNDTVILGWNNGSSATATLDLYTNRNNYDAWQGVGKVKIDSSNNVYACYLSLATLAHVGSNFGYTGSFSSGNITIIGGRITNVT